MPNEWKIRRGDVEGGFSGQLLDGCELRQKADGSGYELIAVLAETDSNEVPIDLPPFAYRGIIWDMDILHFEHGDKGDQPFGHWNNNYKSQLPGEEDGTWTAQAGSGGMGGDEGQEDAASASA
jgi:hypothetical protein